MKGDTQACEKKIARVPSATQNKIVDRIPEEQLVEGRREKELCAEKLAPVHVLRIGRNFPGGEGQHTQPEWH